MKPTELSKVLEAAFKNRRQVLVKGDPGAGKSDIIDAAVRSIGADSLTRHPAVEDPVDVKGLPGCVDGKAEFLPYGDLRRLIEADRLTVVHLEDFGQASVSMQAAYMQLLLRRSVNGHRISEHVVFCASTNDVKDAAGVSGLIEPVKSRFDTIVRLDVSLDDWVNWAIDHAMPVWLIAFLRTRPDLLSDFKPTKQLTNSPCPRTWAAVGRWSNEGVDNLEVWQGAVGQGSATEAWAYRDLVNALPDPDGCLLNPDTSPIPDKPSAKYAMATAVAFRATQANFAQVLKYSARLGKAFEVLTVKDSFRRNQAITKSTAWQQWVSLKENRDICL